MADERSNYYDPPADDLDLEEMDESLDEVVEERSAVGGPVPCEFLTGRAGTGKSYQLQRRERCLLTATTGIAAVNLSSVTLNSVLKYFDTDSMRDIYQTGFLTRTLHGIAQEYDRIAIDEGSMMNGDQLDLLYRGAEEANRYADIKEPLGILLVGDFAQLPPIKAKWAFEASCWEQFARNTVRLDKVWRQDTGPFLDALNQAREGLGYDCAETLEAAGITWHTSRDQAFHGTTILPKNDMVNRHNYDVLDRLAGKAFRVTARRWGKQRPEWGQNKRTHEWGIPPESEFKLGAYVMCLANTPDFRVVNGDCGEIVDRDASAKPAWVDVRLIRTERVERIFKIVRGVEVKERPLGGSFLTIPRGEDFGEWIEEPHYRSARRRFVHGQVEYLPLRLAWASTVHKAQGLTLDRVQVDVRDQFFGSAAMTYVALSRCRTLAGLRIVGQRERFAAQIRMEPKVRGWL